MTWIPVSVRTPRLGQRVVAWADGRWWEAHRTENGLWWASGKGYLWPTHWIEIHPPMEGA